MTIPSSNSPGANDDWLGCEAMLSVPGFAADTPPATDATPQRAPAVLAEPSPSASL